MAKVNGIGGIFIRCKDNEASKAWYAKHLGIQLNDWGGAQFNFNEATAPEGQQPYALLSFFKHDTKYLDPSTGPIMLNLRVDDLDGLVRELSEAGVTLIGTPVDEDYGKFAWIMDPDGNKIELWEQK
jgi:catechol 2,3-dioxygenase-like lactoylglutathione lyase family enzyme